ncbi:dethiobiotin synthase [Shewanella sp. CG12_big_fil_rev_8_21_14_0_65_47_15]|uniref:dethiobiotin synthase n=1 Tax=Shewanella sp. CG12_big_fil_rev_8_21_14_0_65_47_15 TaxID=1975537 RepID=UPI000CAACA48|nr:dethiobiotin synthase [Shewanella sp. CG12_big_fil_rev_8_21_14_0_65_47_15]PIW60382.1 MAG: dethiobiotin synthase [Shewanella sp. CG12_big_fil_rev_8_21_14_0_65_47_15]
MFFVTGTDTDSGKTLVTSGLLMAFNRESARLGSQWLTLGVKPIASGCEMTPAGLRNSDALQLIACSTLKLSYEQVNPFSFLPAVAPHIAAKNAGINLSPQVIAAQLDLPAFAAADLCLLEGAGGWRLPLGEGRYLSELVQQLQLPVILIVGMKLGCLNHALLTQEAILADGLQIAGWVANSIDPDMSVFDENLATLKEMMSAPFLGCIPYLSEPTAENAATYLDIKPLLSLS